MFVDFFKQESAYDMRISDWNSDVFSSDLHQMAGDLNMANAVGRTRQQHQIYNRMLSAGDVLGILQEGPENWFKRERSGKRRKHTKASIAMLLAVRSEAKKNKNFEIGRASCRERVCQYV